MMMDVYLRERPRYLQYCVAGTHGYCTFSVKQPVLCLPVPVLVPLTCTNDCSKQLLLQHTGRFVSVCGQL